MANRLTRRLISNGTAGILAIFMSAAALPAENQAAGDAAYGAETPGLRVLTYNVLRHEVSLFRQLYAFLMGYPSAAYRMAALFLTIDQEAADIIALQEVTPTLLGELKQQDWFSRYHLATTLPVKDSRAAFLDFIHEPNGSVILSKYPYTEVHNERLIPGRLGRRMLVASLMVGETPVTVAICHLDSLAGDHEIRAQQLRQYFGMPENASNTLLLEDFNFAEGEEPESSALHPDYRDLWRSLRPGDPGITYDPVRNPLIRSTGSSRTPGRLDRILMRSDAMEAVGVRITGDHPAAISGKPVYPSDHYGVVATLVRRK